MSLPYFFAKIIVLGKYAEIHLIIYCFIKIIHQKNLQIQGGNMFNFLIGSDFIIIYVRVSSNDFFVYTILGVTEEVKKSRM